MNAELQQERRETFPSILDTKSQYIIRRTYKSRSTKSNKNIAYRRVRKISYFKQLSKAFKPKKSQ